MIEIYKLYNGEVALQYEGIKHRYSVDDKTVYGVTSIINVLSKPALMYWAVNMAIGHLEKNLKPGVVLDEVQISNLLKDAKSAHRVKKDKAADTGTMIHEWLEKFLLAGIGGQDVPKKPINKEMRNAIDSFLEWTKENKVKFNLSEQKIYSVKYGYAGTLDAEGIVNGKRTIIDFKTSNALYPEMFLQAAAYLKAREEETGKEYDGGIQILRLSKENKQKEVRSFEVASVKRENLDQLQKVFLCCLEIYKWRMENKRKALLSK